MNLRQYHKKFLSEMRLARSMPEIQSPTRTLTVIALSIFISETLVMLLIPFLPPLSRPVVAITDSALLLALLSPSLYLFVFRPMVVLHITERDRAKQELLARHEELKKTYETLEQAQHSAIASGKLAAIGRLTAGVSHEIQNPLNIITLRLHLLLNDSKTPPEMVRHLQVLQEQADRIVKVSKDLLSFSRQRAPERAQLNLNETITRSLNLLEYDLRKENIAVELKLADGLPPVWADQDQLQQMVLNLLTNARDAMPRGGRLIIHTGELHGEEKRFVELRAEDTGVGVPTDNLNKLFDPFFTTKPDGEGTGLGLSICQDIIEAHGGSIRAESELGRGTAFIVELPLDQENKVLTSNGT
jgi:signal transduction histidine kinase